MKGSLELFIALRHIRKRKRQTLLSVGAIAIAVMILVVSNAFMAGFTDLLYESTVNDLPHVTVTPQDGEEYIHLYRNTVGDIAAIDGVTATSVSLEREVILQSENNIESAMMKGVIQRDEEAVFHPSGDLIEGDFNRLASTANGVVIGDDLAEELEVKSGDTVDAFFPEAGISSLKVVGIYDTRTPIDSVLVYTDLKMTQEFYGTTDVINKISVRLDDFNMDAEVAEKVDALGYNAAGWTETNPEILQTIAIEGTSNRIILGFILLIASFGVVSSLNMTVMEKTKEIGILKAMGTSIQQIRMIFLIESGILGLLGAAAGTILGVGLALSIGSYEVPGELYQFDAIPVLIRYSDIALTIAIVFALNLVAGIYPAQKAAKMDPVDAISTV
ncbi:lipoprotein-releasing system permease protein [Methanohalophilus levihalophilus]|uniref:ABC transporter permease n=1 Tax=Methanohalophilus levihalophilus TaxID=1431282 RepID=UPI001AE984A0|nr:ABC transporter permease [Methanohalophilus levihalophilus]MBP2030854.1 lipoprotein-releasing system permease protein [Methanohalophilus levihalophilus]